MKKRRRRRRSPPKVSRYRRVVGRLPHSMVALAVVTVGLTFGLASVGWAVDGKPLLAGRTNTETQPTVLDKAGTGPALDLQVDNGPALQVNTKAMVPNLNADLLDGQEADAFATKSALSAEETARNAADTTLQQHIDSEAASRTAAETNLRDPGTINEPSNPVDWSKLKDVPEGFADGEDAVGSSGDVMSTVLANDGSGSNLDADTLDGQDSAVFGIRTSQAGSTAYTCDLANTWNQCGIVTVVVPPGKTYTVSVWSSFSAKAPAGTSREVSYCSGGVGPGIPTSPSPCLTPIFKVRVNDYFTAASSSGERTIGEGRYGFYTAINPSDRFEVAAGSEVITKVMVRDALSPLPQLP